MQWFGSFLGGLTDAGAAFGTASAGKGILESGIYSPDLIWRNLIPVIMAGVNGIYGLITSIVLMSAINKPHTSGMPTYTLYAGFAHLAAGLCCGLCGLASGMAIGICGGSAVRGCGVYDVMQRRQIYKGDYSVGTKKSGKKSNTGSETLFVVMVLVQVFSGNLALYGLITSIIMLTQAHDTCDV